MEISRITPENNEEEPSVATNGLTRKRVMTIALISPQATPAAIPMAKPSSTPWWVLIIAAAVPETAKIAPTERSKPPPMMTSVIPTAMIPSGAFWLSSSLMLSQERKPE